ncbi:Uncharacterised protein [Klebsiella pneumoniae]|nr:Uncharacterised protein [Klebsiella pneumoniae]VCZ65153.1 hypothetical protein BANRA_05453 [Klebsiella pneumoniae]
MISPQMNFVLLLIGLTNNVLNLILNCLKLSHQLLVVGCLGKVRLIRVKRFTATIQRTQDEKPALIKK